MITQNNLKIYKKYSGDIDAFVRFSSKSEQLLIDESTWNIIGGLIEDISIIKKDLW